MINRLKVDALPLIPYWCFMCELKKFFRNSTLVRESAHVYINEDSHNDLIVGAMGPKYYIDAIHYVGMKYCFTKRMANTGKFVDVSLDLGYVGENCMTMRLFPTKAYEMFGAVWLFDTHAQSDQDIADRLSLVIALEMLSFIRTVLRDGNAYSNGIRAFYMKYPNFLKKVGLGYNTIVSTANIPKGYLSRSNRYIHRFPFEDERYNNPHAELIKYLEKGL